MLTVAGLPTPTTCCIYLRFHSLHLSKNTGTVPTVPNYIVPANRYFPREYPGIFSTQVSMIHRVLNFELNLVFSMQEVAEGQ